MSILNEASLDFAKNHITQFYDSDFFPRTFEFDALWHSWEDVKKELMSKNIQKHWVSSPRTITSAKPTGGFRVVQQLNPIATLIYTALAHSVAEQVETAREPKHIACSYRIDLNQDSFFAEGNGFGEFSQQSETFAKEHEFVLATDITDFYNQIYLHRLNNAIEFCDPNLKHLGDDLEGFLSALNGKSSQGIPVGPTASIIMAEAVLIDIDKFLTNSPNIKHTRYVDDFRIFSNSEEELTLTLERLTLYLYENHRLTLSSEKTKIIKSQEYVSEILHNHYEIEKIEIFKKLRIFNPYSHEHKIVKRKVRKKKELAKEQIKILAEKVLERTVLDLGLSRALIRKAKAYEILDVAPFIFDNFQFFSPIINDVCLYLSSVTDREFVEQWKEQIIAVTKLPVMKRDLVRLWFEWYISNNEHLLNIKELKDFIYLGNNIPSQAQASILLKNIAWVRDKKSSLYNVGDWERRAILHASQILPQDEKYHWLKSTETTAPMLIDRWVAKWVRSL